ncbi:MAG TPA: class I SAM-dependent methyltransferase [Longimicrobiaceae bacterium]|nr:class I SAM-dependent methyltransferase [Longimicrobiaceae bacterium]
MLPSLLRGLGARLLDRVRGHESVFTRIYQRNGWGDPESVSGPGSTRERGASFTPDVVRLLRRLDARVLLDAPCGDFNWAAEIADAVEEYVGVDMVRELVLRNQREHQRPGRRFLHADLTRDPLPRADVILCRDCLVHFSDRDVWAALRNFRRSGSKYLLTTTFLDRPANAEIRTGGWRPLNLEAAPFHLPPPADLVDERCLHTGGIYADKRLALWALDTVPEGPRGAA